MPVGGASLTSASCLPVWCCLPACLLVSPFGWDSHDLPLESFALDLHRETLAYAEALGEDATSYIPDYLQMGHAKALA